MKRTNIYKLFALMLALSLLLCSCSGGGGKSYDPDEPVTAEPLVENFIEGEEKPTPVYNRAELIDDYGKVQSDNRYEIVFKEEKKDHLNNLTQTYNVYSIKEGKVVLSLSNTYADEYNGLDKHGNQYRPPVTLDVMVVRNYSVSIIVASYTTYTAIADEIIEEEELTESYYSSTLTKFYTAKGELIAESTTTQRPSVCGHSRRYVAFSLGRTVAIFDGADGSIVRTLDGDTERVAVPDVINEKYEYYLGASEFSAEKATRIEVYNKSGSLVLSYSYSTEPGVIGTASVLDNGDILIQNLVTTEALEPEAYLMGTPVNVDTFLLDVESGKLVSYDFEYYLFGTTMTRDDILLESDGEVLPTENVRNYASGVKIEKGRDLYDNDGQTIVFFDNLLNVNLVIENKIDGEADGFMPGTALADGYRLIDPVSGVTERAIIDKDGKLVSYVPDGAFVSDNYIVTKDAVYTFEMELVYRFENGYYDSYDEVTIAGTVGNYLVYSIKDTEYVGEDEVDDYRVDFIYIGENPEDGEYNGEEYFYDNSYYDYTIVDIKDNIAILSSTENNVYVIVSGTGRTLISVIADSAPYVYETLDDAVIISYTYEYETFFAKLFVETVDDDEMGGHE